MSSVKDKHILFVQEYLSNGFIGSQAYKKVYNVSDRVAEASAPRLLRNVSVRKMIEEEQKKNEQMFQIKKEDLIKDLIKIKNDNIDDAPPFSIKAIEVINKMMGYNATEKSEITITEQPLLPDEDE
jgi:phage terminase small subunit